MQAGAILHGDHVGPLFFPSTAVQAAIFSADVEGYTRLMNIDEGATMRLLTSYRDITDRLITGHGGSPWMGARFDRATYLVMLTETGSLVGNVSSRA
jgi:class 3 adenylate cyclase